MVTLKDVAKRANVSLSTASYSMNGSPLITNETRQKVLTAAEEIGYRPNGMAKNLKTKKTNIIGLFLSGFTGPFFNDMVEGIQDVVMENGYELVVCASVETHRLLVERYVDGAIILNYHMEDQLLQTLANEKMPFVVMDREIQNPYIKNIVLPNHEGAKMIVDYLVQKGHARIGFVGGSEESYDGETRLTGFMKALSNHDMMLEKSDLIRADFTEESGYTEMKAYMEMKSSIPSAFVCANDEMAMGAIRAARENGIKVPEELAITGFDDIFVSRHFTPSLTTVKVPRKEWGTIAAQTLFKMLNKDFDYTPEGLKVELMARNSG